MIWKQHVLIHQSPFRPSLPPAGGTCSASPSPRPTLPMTRSTRSPSSPSPWGKAQVSSRLSPGRMMPSLPPSLPPSSPFPWEKARALLLRFFPRNVCSTPPSLPPSVFDLCAFSRSLFAPSSLPPSLPPCSDAPDDYVALRELRDKPDYRSKFHLTDDLVSPPSLPPSIPSSIRLFSTSPSLL